MAGINIEGATSGNLAEVDANSNLKVNTPTTASLAGVVAVGGVVSDGVAFPSNAARQVRRIEASDSFRIRAGIDSTLFNAIFPAAALDTSIWNQSTSTMTITQTQGNMNINASLTGTASKYAIANTWRSFPIFQDAATRFDCTLSLSVAPLNHTIVEWGLFQCATNATPLDGVFFRMSAAGNVFAVVNNNGTEITLDTTFTPASTLVRVDYAIIVDVNNAYFYINDNLCATIAVATTGSVSTGVDSQPATFRVSTDGSGAASGPQLSVNRVNITLLDCGAGRPWPMSMTGQGGMSIQGQTGATLGTLANYPTAAGAPTSQVPANTGGTGYTTLGGQWQFAAIVSAQTDAAFFAWTNPVGTVLVPGRTLYITSVRIEMYNMVANNATTPTLLQWGMGVGANAISLAVVADTTAGVKVARRILLGYTAIGTGGTLASAIGTPSPFPLEAQFYTPLVVNQSEFCHIIVSPIVATATASQVIRGTCTINGYFE